MMKIWKRASNKREQYLQSKINIVENRQKRQQRNLDIL